MVSLGNAQMGLGLTVRLVDQFSGRAAAVTSQMASMQKQAYAMSAATLTTARNYGMGMAVAGAVMTAGFGDMVKSAAKFDWLMTGTRAVTQATVEEYKKMSATAIALSTRYIYTAQEVAGAMEYLGKAGFRVSDVNATIEAVTRLGAATDTAIGGKGGVADMMTNMMTTFNMAAKDSSRMADVLTYATTRANLDISDLHESMKFVGQAATDLKIPFEDAAAMTTVLANAGLRGGMGGRSLANMLLYLASSVGKFRTKGQTDVFKMLGMHPDMLRQVNGELLPMTKIIGIFQQKLSKFTGPDKVSALRALLNIRGSRAMTPLVRATQLGLNLEEMITKMNQESQGIAKRISDMRLSTLQGQSKVLVDIWTAFKVEVGTILSPLMMNLVKKLQTLVKWGTAFAKSRIGKPIIALAAGGALVMTVFGAMTAILATIRLGMMATGAAGTTAASSIAAAWGRATGAMTAYNVMQNASFIGAGGQVAKKGTKGFISSAGGSMAGAAVGTGIWGRFTKMLGRITPLFGQLGRWLMRMPGWAKAIGALILVFADFGGISKWLMKTLTRLGLAVGWARDYIMSGGDKNYADKRYDKRDYELGVNMGYRKPYAQGYEAQQDKTRSKLEEKIDKAWTAWGGNALQFAEDQPLAWKKWQAGMSGDSTKLGRLGLQATHQLDSGDVARGSRELKIVIEIGGKHVQEHLIEILNDNTLIHKE